MGGNLCSMDRQAGNACNRVDVANQYAHVYHEKQVKELCAMHAMNNLLQEKEAFTQKSMDRICYELSPGYFINPHKSMFGTGNYDVNVIMKAMNTKGYEVIWFDRRKRIEDSLNLENILGFILNTTTEYKIAGLIPLTFHRKHWIAVRKVGGFYYNLDSKLSQPICIRGEQEVQEYLQEQLDHEEKELLLVVTEAVNAADSWKLDRNTDMFDVPTSSTEKTTPDELAA